VAPTVVVASWVFIRQNRPTLEWEVASYSVLCSWREGREESTMDQMSTIMVKTQTQRAKVPFLALKVNLGPLVGFGV
jgi:hypothetical protein